MPASLKRIPEYNLEMGVFSGAVTAQEILGVFSGLDQNANWLGVFTRGADVSGVDIACFPALKRAVTPGEAEGPADGEARRSALVNLSEASELFVRFWAHYASAGPRSRKRRMFSAIEAACAWLRLPPAAVRKIDAIVAQAESAPEPGASAAESRRKLLKAASRIFRLRGYDAMTLDEVVAAADLPGLTLGGLAQSKDDLIVHALLDAMGDVAPIQGDMGDYAAGYLSPRHKTGVAEGCAMAALASETLRQSPAARAAMTAGLTWHIDRLSQVAPGEDDAARHRAAVRAWAAMIGAIILARVSDDEKLSQEFLDETQAWIADPAVAAAKAPKGQPYPALRQTS
jgi:TetR/AcrR family transcriptional repressor of nem operon